MVVIGIELKLVRLSPVLTLLSCDGLICVLAFSLSGGVCLEPLKDFDISVPAVWEKKKNQHWNTTLSLCDTFNINKPLRFH